MSPSLQQLEAELAHFERLELPLFGRRESAVLVPLVEVDGSVCLLLTRRSSSLPHHAGEVSFPGGAVEAGDASSRDAALREACEEVGIAPGQCRFIGTLDDTPTVTGFRITPHVAVCDSVPDAAPRDGEVEALLLVPLDFFLDAGPGYEMGIEVGGSLHRSPVYVYRGSFIWGATARMIRDLCALVRGSFDDDGTDARLRRIARRVLAAAKVLLTTHINPDPDGLGCQVALEEMLLSIGREVAVVNHHPVPERFKELAHRSACHTQPEAVAAAAEGADLLLVVDTAEKNRIGSPARLLERFGGRVAVIDHHLSGDLGSNLSVMDSRFSSTCEIVQRLLQRIGYRMSRRCADALMTGILFDTHSFRFINNSPTPLRAAAHLLETGADATAIQDRLFARVPMGHARVLGHALARARLEFDAAFMWGHITKDELQGLGASNEDAGDVSAFFATLEGVQIGLFMREINPGQYKLSFRSRREYPIGDICQKHGGGGHANAGGATMTGTPEQILSAIRNDVAAVLARGR
jgi:phosphoesterase RecJ-like protein